MFDFIAEILAFVIRPIYNVVQNYGWTIIIFTVLIKLLTLPFTIKSQKSMAKMQQVQPLISEVQKKYANNKEKQQQELMKIYEKYQISPTGGCLPLLVQMIILMGFIQIVYKPVTFILGISKTTINEAITSLGLKAADYASNQLNMFNNQELLDKLGISVSDLNFDFLGIDLTKVLSQNMTDVVCWILPVLALVFTILSTIMSQRQAMSKRNPASKNDPQSMQTEAMSKSMYIMMPLMTIFITYTWPLGCALYWIISTLTQMLQQFFVQKFVVDKMEPIELKPKKKPKPKNTGMLQAIEADMEEDGSDEPSEKPASSEKMNAKSKKQLEIEEDFAPKAKEEKQQPRKKSGSRPPQQPKSTAPAAEKSEDTAPLGDIVDKINNESDKD